MIILKTNTIHLRRTLLVTAFLCGTMFSHGAYANPTGGVVVGGSASINSSGKVLTVDQTSQRAVIDWRSFDIDVDEITQFNQPNSSSVAVNRVNSADPSYILGQLKANGNIVLINPNGLFFGADSVVDVNGLIATTSDITNENAMAGNFRFDQFGNPDGTIVNNGLISAKDSGLVGLVAPNVINNGIIQARLGRVELASADTFTADFYGDGLLDIEVTDPEIKSQIIQNKGIISANGGVIKVSAAAARHNINALIDVDGYVSAQTVSERGGKIIIGAIGSNKTNTTGDSYVAINGIIDVSGRDEGEQGGSIQILGDHIALTGNALIDASGFEAPIPNVKPSLDSATLTADKDVKSNDIFMADNRRAGGSIMIGGDYLGRGDTQTAKTLNVQQGALIVNDAVNKGDGGRTILWSDDTTDFSGSVFARGGQLGGNGGFLETSGKVNLRANGYADLSNRDGFYHKGTYLMDPDHITIYGNVDPRFASTDNSINLNDDLALWLDASDQSYVVLTYSTNNVSTTASGIIGTNTITTASNVSGHIRPGVRIRLGAGGNITTADNMGPDTYTITNISGSTITVAETLSKTYTGEIFRRGLVSGLRDKSDGNNQYFQTVEGEMPLWIDNNINGLASIYFDGGNDDLANDGTFELAGTLDYFSSYHAESAVGTLFLLPSDNVGTRSPFEVAITSSYGGYTDIGFTANHIGVIPTHGYNDANILNRNALLNIDWNGNDHTQSSNYFSSLNGETKTVQGNGNFGHGSTEVSSLGNRSVQRNTDFRGFINDTFVYGTNLSLDEKALMNQYQSAKWGIELVGQGTGTNEVERATATNGYNVFTTRYLERLANTADIHLQAAQTITLDLKNDVLDLTNGGTAGKSITLEAANGDITDVSGGTIRTTRAGVGAGLNGNIELITAGIGNITLDETNLEALSGGEVILTSDNDISITQASELNLGTVTSGTLTLETTGGGSDIIFNQDINISGGISRDDITASGTLLNTANIADLVIRTPEPIVEINDNPFIRLTEAVRRIFTTRPQTDLDLTSSTSNNPIQATVINESKEPNDNNGVTPAPNSQTNYQISSNMLNLTIEDDIVEFFQLDNE